MYETILVPTDGSDGARGAVAHGLGLAETYGATDGIVDVLERRGERATEEIREQASIRGLDAVAAVVRGTPAGGSSYSASSPSPIHRTPSIR